MTRELFVVCVLRDSAWVEVGEFDDEGSAHVRCDELRATELNVWVMSRWVKADHVDLEPSSSPHGLLMNNTKRGT